MADSPPLRPAQAKNALEGDGGFLLSICEAELGLLMGEDLAVTVLTTVGG